MPDYLLERIVGREQWDGHRPPFNRGMRRKIEATSVVVHVFSGDPGRWVELVDSGKVSMWLAVSVWVSRCWNNSIRWNEKDFLRDHPSFLVWPEIVRRAGRTSRR